MRPYSTLALLLLLTNRLHAQPLQWAASMGGTDDDRGQQVAVDAAGNIHVCGTFNGVADLDPGPGVLSATSNGYTDFFVQKLDADGNLIYAHALGSALQDFAVDITCDAAGNTYVTGQFQSTIDLDPGPGTLSFTPAGSLDLYVMKLDPAGDLLWVIALGGSTIDGGRGIAVDAGGNVHVAGFFTSTVDFDPGPGTATKTAVSANDIFVLKLDANGALIWVACLGAAGMDTASDLALDSDGRVYTTGNFNLTVDFDPGTGYAPLTASGGADAFVSVLDANGAHVWAKRFGSTNSEDDARGLALDGQGNVLISGTFANTADFDPGSGVASVAAVGDYDAFVNKLDPTGAFVWARAVGSVDEDRGNAIAVDADDNVFVGGKFSSTIDLDPGTGVAPFSSAGAFDAFVLRLTAAGDYMNAATFGAAGDDLAWGVLALPANELLATGWYQNTVDFDPGPSDVSLTSAGDRDAYLLKFGDFSTFIDASAPEAVGVGPNPVMDRLFVAGLSGPSNYVIHDGLGRTILSGSISGAMNGIDVNELPGGPYILHLNGDAPRAIKFLKE